jgi:hypothetical protein
MDTMVIDDDLAGDIACVGGLSISRYGQDEQKKENNGKLRWPGYRVQGGVALSAKIGKLWLNSKGVTPEVRSGGDPLVALNT